MATFPRQGRFPSLGQRNRHSKPKLGDADARFLLVIFPVAETEDNERGNVAYATVPRSQAGHQPSFATPATAGWYAAQVRKSCSWITEVSP